MEQVENQDQGTHSEIEAVVNEAKQVLDAVMDDASGSPSMEKLRLAGQLAGLLRDMQALGEDSANLLQKLKITGLIRDVLQKLGAGAAPAQAPATAENEHVVTLRSVVSGVLDSLGVVELFGRIQEAVHALRDGDLLSGEAESVANDALTHWGELESAANA